MSVLTLPLNPDIYLDKTDMKTVGSQFCFKKCESLFTFMIESTQYNKLICKVEKIHLKNVKQKLTVGEMPLD